MERKQISMKNTISHPTMSTNHALLKCEPSFTETYYEDVIRAIDDLLIKTAFLPIDIDSFKHDLSTEISQYKLFRQYIESTLAEMQEVVSELFNLYNDYLEFPEDFDYVEEKMDYFWWAKNYANKEQLTEFHNYYQTYVESLSNHHLKLANNVKLYLELYFEIVSKRALLIDNVS